MREEEQMAKRTSEASRRDGFFVGQCQVDPELPEGAAEGATFFGEGVVDEDVVVVGALPVGIALVADVEAGGARSTSSSSSGSMSWWNAGRTCERW